MRLLWLVISLVLAIGTGHCAFRPVCVPLSSEDLAAFSPPIVQRADRDLYLRVFQFREGQWHQCKPWLSRQFFF